jgi:hypothetical protein
MTRPLPPIAPCPCGMRPRTNRWLREWNVVCYSCDRRGAAKKTEHLGSECHIGIRDIDTHRALAAECERAGWEEAKS